jgi:hypothetical protein
MCTAFQKLTLKCYYCGNEFQTYFPQRRSCQDPQCSRKAIRDAQGALKIVEPPREAVPKTPAAKKVKRTYRTQICENCGATFKTLSNNAKCCSEKCRAYKNRKARNPMR